jgi:hypothetical protein
LRTASRHIADLNNQSDRKGVILEITWVGIYVGCKRRGFPTETYTEVPDDDSKRRRRPGNGIVAVN